MQAARQRAGAKAPGTCLTRAFKVAKCHGTAKARAARGRGRLVVRAGPVESNDEDLMQIPDRLKWYEAKFAADDMPDWNPATFVSSQQLAPDLRNIVLRVEVSRERVPIRNAYKHVGQLASVRLGQGLERQLTIASAPFRDNLNKEAFYKVRGDLVANEVKSVKPEAGSASAELHLLVSRAEAPEVYNLADDEPLDVGPFTGSGIDLRSAGLLAIYRFPTLVIFASGSGIATARALLEAGPDVCGLNVPFRTAVRLYYKAPNEASMAYRDRFEDWAAAGCPVVTTTKTFGDAFDDDDTFAYDPEYTGAIILTGGDAEDEAAAREVCAEAEIAAIATDSVQAERPVYLTSTPKSFQAYSQKQLEPR